MLYVCIEYHVWVNMYHVSTQGVDERVINVHYYLSTQSKHKSSMERINTHFKTLLDTCRIIPKSDPSTQSEYESEIKHEKDQYTF